MSKQHSGREGIHGPIKDANDRNHIFRATRLHRAYKVHNPGRGPGYIRCLLTRLWLCSPSGRRPSPIKPNASNNRRMTGSITEPEAAEIGQSMTGRVVFVFSARRRCIRPLPCSPHARNIPAVRRQRQLDTPPVTQRAVLSCGRLCQETEGTPPT